MGSDPVLPGGIKETRDLATAVPCSSLAQTACDPETNKFGFSKNHNHKKLIILMRLKINNNH